MKLTIKISGDEMKRLLKGGDRGEKMFLKDNFYRRRHQLDCVCRVRDPLDPLFICPNERYEPDKYQFEVLKIRPDEE